LEEKTNRNSLSYLF